MTSRALSPGFVGRRRVSLAAWGATTLLAVELWALFSDVHFLWRPVSSTVPRAEIGRVRSVSGGARVRRPLQLNWEKTREGEALLEGDELATLDGESVSVRLADGQVIALGPNSLLALKRSRFLEERSFNLALLSGTLRRQGGGVHGSQRASRIELQVGGERTILGPGEDTPGSRLAFRAQDAPIAFDFGGRARPRPLAEAKPPLARPRLIRPTVEKAEPDAPMNLGAPVLEKPVVHYDNEGGALFRVLDFVAGLVELEARAADAQAEIAPKRYSVTLRWHEVERASAYVLQIAADPSFTRLAGEKYVTGASFTWRTDVAGVYFWRVGAIDSDGDKGPFSEFMTFAIRPDRNVVLDETSYDTFRRYDEYAWPPDEIRLLAGPSLSAYSFSSGDRGAPDSVNYSFISAKNFAAEYEYRIDSRFSGKLYAAIEDKTVTGSSFSGRPQQNTLVLDTTNVSLGLERRFFGPRHYFTLEGGLRFTFADIPVKQSDTQLDLSTFSFLGLYGLGGYRFLLSSRTELQGTVGPLFQYTNASIRYGAAGYLEILRQATDVLSFGARLELEMRFYRFDADNLSGRARSYSVRPMALAQFTF